MKRTTSLSFLLSLSATLIGCAGDSPSGPKPGDDDVNPDEPEQPVPLTPEGKFDVQSEFDLSKNMPGTAGTVASYFIEATDEPEDPTKFLVDELIKALPDGGIKNAIEDVAPFVTGYLNDRLLQVAPSFVTKIIDVGDAFGQVVEHFGTNELLEIDASGRSTKTVHGLHFKIDNIEMDFAFADYGLENSKTENLQVTLESTGKLTVADHKVPLKYGQVLRIALDQAIIPLIDPSAQNLGDLLHGAVNCEKVGQFIYEAIDIGSPSTFESACESGLTLAAGALYNKLEAIDGAALEFGLTGVGRGVDRDRNGSMDDITAGTYTGNMSYAGTPAPLGAAKFFGKRK
ncbi:MAG: hypothetical protein WKG01_25840 [Kofleriaceae bacterium]